MKAPVRSSMPSHRSPPIDGEFRQVTDMAWDAAGNTYISDGYINSRVAKIDKDGNWIKSWGEPGAGPGQFNTPHSIATDDAGNVYVADRGNGRIQVFDGDGKYLREIHIDVPYDHGIRPWMGNKPAEVPATAEAPAPLNKTMLNGSPWAICITPGPHQVLFASDGYPGRIYKLTLDGNVAWRARHNRPWPRPIWLDSRVGLPVRNRRVCRRAAELASAEAGA